MRFGKWIRAFKRLQVGVVVFGTSFLSCQKARVVFGVIDIMVALIVIGTMGASAWNFGATNFSQADAAVQVMVGTVVPMIAGVAVLMLFLGSRRK